jgi:putative membrane protein
MIAQADIKRVVEAIGAAEARTAGEIFCVVTRSSSNYHLVPIAWAALVALILPLPAIYLTAWPAGAIYLAQLAVFVVVAAGLSVPAARFRIVPKRAKQQRAHAEAMRQFLAQGLHLTEQRTGVLIFASVAERYAEIIADRHQHQGRQRGLATSGRRARRRDKGRSPGRRLRRRRRAVWRGAGAALSARSDQAR